jgi:Na+/phosphate symporter
MPHTAGTRSTRTTGHRAPTRRSRPKRPVPASRLVALLLLAPVIGMFFGGAVFVLLCVAAATLAAVRVQPTGLWWVLPAAPLAIWVVSVGRQLLDASSETTKQAVAVAHGMIDAFPAILLALVAAAMVAVVRWSHRGRSARV